jgi:hypothetical protein
MASDDDQTFVLEVQYFMRLHKVEAYELARQADIARDVVLELVMRDKAPAHAARKKLRAAMKRIAERSAAPARPARPPNVARGAAGGTADRSVEPAPPAVVFTHLTGIKPFEPGKNLSRADKAAMISRYTETFASYCRVNEDRMRIKAVVAYVDVAVKPALGVIPTKAAAQLRQRVFDGPFKLITYEAVVIDALEESVIKAADGSPRHHRVKFIFIGLATLLELFNHLIEAEPTLLRFLAGSNNKFTYDSPKFPEAVLRICRGDLPQLAREPVIRIDDDVTPDARSIDTLLAHFHSSCGRQPFVFFSGRYGDGKDLVNDYAVRTAWFFPPGTRHRDERFTGPADPAFERGKALCLRFLEELSMLGAPQLTASGAQPQVISGAGLIMSRRAVVFLPPFMNFAELITWVDDFIKRRLHETMGDIEPTECESVQDACFEQNRHAGGITLKDHEFSEQKYFERLLRGCVLHALVITDDGKPTLFSEHIRKIAWGIRSRKSELLRMTKGMKRVLTRDMGINARRRCNKVLQRWSADAYRETILHAWATKQLTGNVRDLWKPVVDDALKYIELVEHWPIFVRAIERLTPDQGEWWFP